MPEERLRIVFAIYPGMTQLDFTVPYQILSGMPGCEVIVASAEGGEVCSDGDGLIFAGNHRLADVDACDLICVPGGGRATEVALDERFVGQVRRLTSEAWYVTSVCTGSLILSAAGLPVGRRASSHWAWRYRLSLFGAIADDGRVGWNGNVITGGSVTAGMDFALPVLAELVGDKLAEAIHSVSTIHRSRSSTRDARTRPLPTSWQHTGSKLQVRSRVVGVRLGKPPIASLR